MRRGVWITVTWAAGMILVAGSPAPGSPGVAAVDSAGVASVDSSFVIATVTYVVGSTAYFDAGREQGLAAGLEGVLVRDGKTLGKITVLDLSSRRGSGSIETGVTAQVGDRARFSIAARPVEAVAPLVAPVVTPAYSTPAGDTFMSRMGIRGRAGVRYLAVRDRTDTGGQFDQPALDLALEARHPGGTPLSLAVDARARHTYVSGGEDEARTRVYRLEADWDGPSRLRLSLGRLVAPQLPSIGIIDGGRVEIGLHPVALGAFFGTQPEPDTYAMSGDVKQYGVYSHAQGTISKTGRWGGTLGWANSTASGEPNRNFFYLSAQLTAPRYQLFGNQDVDLNWGWKADAEGQSVTLSNTYVSGRYQIVPSFAVRAGFDNRRNVRLFRDRETPESQFDDSYRQGFSLGTEWRGSKRWNLDLSYRASHGVEGDAHSGTLAFRVLRFPAVATNLNLRGTVYRGPTIDGWLAALGLNWRASSRLDVGAHGGLRIEDRSFGLGEKETIGWFGAEGDLSLLSAWYLSVSAELTRGTAERTDQIYTSLSYRF